MNVIPTRLPGVVIVVPRIFSDSRGYFLETWNHARFAEVGIRATFVQDNLSFSKRGVLRGLHLQAPNAQAKLVSVLAGEVYDIAVDVRAGSPTFGEWVGVPLSPEAHRQLFIPAGFAHGFVVTSESATVSYKCDAFYSPGSELTILWNDPALGIEWPVSEPILSAKDREGLRLRDVPLDRLPPYDES
jgi:dTDP-4-dehydrorhamnose 3,5-epimerase